MTTRERIEELVRQCGPIHDIRASVDELERMVGVTPEVFRQQMRLKCAEIIFTTGSQAHREKIEEHAERLYRFATDGLIEKKD